MVYDNKKIVKNYLTGCSFTNPNPIQTQTHKPYATSKGYELHSLRLHQHSTCT